MASIWGVIQNLRWAQSKYASKIMRVAVENSSFGYNVSYEIWISEGLGFLA